MGQTQLLHKTVLLTLVAGGLCYAIGDVIGDGYSMPNVSFVQIDELTATTPECAAMGCAGGTYSNENFGGSCPSCKRREVRCSDILPPGMVAADLVHLHTFTGKEMVLIRGLEGVYQLKVRAGLLKATLDLFKDCEARVVETGGELQMMIYVVGVVGTPVKGKVQYNIQFASKASTSPMAVNWHPHSQKDDYTKGYITGSYTKPKSHIDTLKKAGAATVMGLVQTSGGSPEELGLTGFGRADPRVHQVLAEIECLMGGGQSMDCLKVMAASSCMRFMCEKGKAEETEPLKKMQATVTAIKEKVKDPAKYKEAIKYFAGIVKGAVDSTTTVEKAAAELGQGLTKECKAGLKEMMEVLEAKVETATKK